MRNDKLIMEETLSVLFPEEQFVFMTILLPQFDHAQPEKHIQHYLLVPGIHRKNFLKYSLAEYSASSCKIKNRWRRKGYYQIFGNKNDGMLNNNSFEVDKAGHFSTHIFCFLTLNGLIDWGEFDDTKTNHHHELHSFYVIASVVPTSSFPQPGGSLTNG